MVIKLLFRSCHNVTFSWCRCKSQMNTQGTQASTKAQTECAWPSHPSCVWISFLIWVRLSLTLEKAITVRWAGHKILLIVMFYRCFPFKLILTLFELPKDLVITEESFLTGNLGFPSWAFLRFATISAVPKAGGAAQWQQSWLAGWWRCRARGVRHPPHPRSDRQPQLHGSKTKPCKEAEPERPQTIFHMQMNLHQFQNWIQSNYFFQYSVLVTCYLPVSTFCTLNGWL